MAKKTAARKPKRRLKKTARRSLAAVLMVTAIAVAAIPAPENLADTPGSRAGEEVVSPVAYVEGDVKPIPMNDSKGNKYVLDVTDGSGDTEDEVEKRISDGIANGDLVPTEIVTRYGGELYLTWQFLYEPTANKTGRLCKYNDEFPAEKVNLGLQPNRAYFIVYENAYQLYFTDPSQLNQPGAAANAVIKNMDNLNAATSGDNTVLDFWPTKKIEFNLLDMDRRTEEIALDEKAIEYFRSYFANDYESALNRFKAYWGVYNKAYDEAIAEGKDAATAKTEAEAAAGDIPEGLSKAPSDIDNEADRKRFFCEHNRILKGTGYTLEIASDRRKGAGGDRVYVAHGGKVSEDSTYKDVDGYLVEKDDCLITSIAYRAFADVHNVKQIEIDQYVKTIEQSAFHGADIASVDIGNAKTIGNRAFYGCKRLTSVTFSETSPTDTIGIEAFYGSGINTKLEFPRHISSIGHGAFAACLDLAEVQFFDTGDNCSLADFAFYGDTRLTKVDFARTVVTRIGKAAFAIPAPSGDVMTEFKFPGEGLDTMDDYVLANRQKLKEVYIQNYTKKVPLHTFYNCFDLTKVEFSDKCGAASFDSELFKDVTADGFCVYGPELYANSPAYPRTSTWDAVRTDGKGIPYVYIKDGKKYYEMALDSDGTRYRYAASEDGTLISCALISKNPGLVDLVIPEYIGDFKIKSIGPGCFDDKELREVIRSITIKNNSVAEIGDGVFRDLKKLKKVRIGDSVTKIGANAFAGCSSLYDVYFTRPSAGHAALKIGTDAFVTTGDHLTFHGDIVEGYAPFVLAMDPNNVLRDPDHPNYPPVNICYQSLWDSQEGGRLTVMPDKSTGEVTLLDYPKMKDLENIAADDELQDFCRDMEEYYYYTVYNTDSSEINTMRSEYADIFDAKRTAKGSVTLNGGAGPTILAADYDKELLDRYGPWINPVYCSGSWLDYRTGQGTAKGSIVDFLFEPMIVEAIDNPTPYFEAYPYDFMENYNNWLTMEPEEYGALREYQQVPEKVWNFIHATQDIYVPEGVDSIDVITYMEKNRDNYNKYIKDRPADTMYTTTLGGAVPGLFSGYYRDFEEDDDEDREKEVRGNDTIQSVILKNVKTLPDYAFDSCEQLSRLEIPAVTKVGKLPFRDCENLINLTGSVDYPAERGILYERHKDADGNDRYRIIQCLLARGRSGTGNEELAVATISSATDSLIPFLCETCDTDKDGTNVLPAIAEGAFEGCKYIASVNLTDAAGLKTIPKNAFKDCNKIGQMILPGSVNKIADDAFTRTATSGTTHMNVTIYGREVDIADNAFTPRSDFTIYSYEDSAARRYADRYQIDFQPLNACRVWFYDYDGTPLGGAVTVDTGTRITDIPDAAKVVLEKNHRPGYDFDKWLSDEGKSLDDPIENDMTIFVAQYTSNGTMVDGKCSVQFVHGRTGQVFSGRGADDNDRYLIVPGTAFSDPINGELPTPVPSPNPTEDGYTFMNEFRTDVGEKWTPDTIISRNMTVLALFERSGGDGNISGGTTSNGSTSGGTTSGGSSNNNNSSKGSSSNKNSSSSSSSSTSSSSTSTTSTTSGAGQYTVFVEGGSGSGSYAPGTTVIISCYVPADGMRFEKWTTDSNGVALAGPTMTTTTFTMPANNVSVKANYVEAPKAPEVAVNTGGGTGNGGSGGNSGTTDGNGNTRVDIEKPGISNRDLANANTNGSSDNFIVKISETDEATRAVAAALTNKYGTLDNILYYAMDISLYDSTGTTKITDTTGLSVDITIPIPDSLVAYGGNNMAGAVINGDQLESLNESFTTINGVPCIRFRATHFSPYTVYVDTGNLVEGMLDVTPKTGDPIHPKWFLSLGLACLSIILFMKRDKKVTAKA